MNTVRADKPSAHAVFFGETARGLYEKNAAGTLVGVFSHALYADFGGEIVSFYDAAYGEVPFGVAVRDILAFLAAAALVLGMLPLCAAYRRYKAAHPDGWTRYV